MRKVLLPMVVAAVAALAGSCGSGPSDPTMGTMGDTMMVARPGVPPASLLPR